MGGVTSWIGTLSNTSKIVVLGGSLIVAVGLIYGGHQLYKYCTRTEKVSEAKTPTNRPLTIDEIKTLNWSILEITEEELKKIKTLTKTEFF